MGCLAHPVEAAQFLFGVNLVFVLKRPFGLFGLFFSGLFLLFGRAAVFSFNLNFWLLVESSCLRRVISKVCSPHDVYVVRGSYGWSLRG